MANERMQSTVIVGGGLVLVLALLLACSKKGDGAAAGSEAAPVPVELATLLSDYKGNEVRADQTYKDKRIRVTGVVGDVKKDIVDDMYVTIGSGAAFEIPVVQCMLPKSQQAKAAALDKGTTVTVTGTVTGLMVNVLVKDCEIGATQKPAAPPLGAAAEKACAAMAKAKIAKDCARDGSDAGPGVAIFTFKLVEGKHAGLITEYADDALYQKASAKLAANPKLASCDDAPHRLVLLMDPGASAADKIGPCMWLAMP